MAANKNARAALEKDVAVQQGRLSKFREQAMAVKTNQEYHAVQHEIAFAQTEIKKIEDTILERMMESDDLTSALKAAEAQLAAEIKAVDAERRTGSAAHIEMQAALERIAGERAVLVAGLNKDVLGTFEAVSRKRNGVAMSEARGGVCTICHVRLRPQVFNTVLRNDSILQCDHCNRILYYVPVPASAATAPSDRRRSGRRDPSIRLGALPFDTTAARRGASSPTSTAARAAIPARPASASASRKPTAR